ncbi:MAG: hypothetical protein K2X50_03910 [Gammaproteobacteria bacterium]|nr:hypothetical protein [Gammaproteobacteria bacterium]
MQDKNEKGKEEEDSPALIKNTKKNVESDDSSYPEDQKVINAILNKDSSLPEIHNIAQIYLDYVAKHNQSTCSQTETNSRTIRKVVLLLNTVACKYPAEKLEAEKKIAAQEMEFIKINLSKSSHAIKNLQQCLDENKLNRHRISLIRSYVAQKTKLFKHIFNKGQIDSYASEKIHSEISSLFRDFLRDIIINQVLPFFWRPHCEFAIIPLGSTARGEMTPYSDLEFAILYERNEGEEDINIKHYFRIITEYLYIKIANLGETRIRGEMSDFPPGVDFTFDQSIPKGFTFDPGKNTPLGKKGEHELIGTPDEISRYLSIDFIKRNSTLWTILNTLSSENIIYSTKFGSSIVVDFIRIKNALINTVDYRSFLFDSMNVVLARFRVSLGKLEDQGRVLNVKYGLYRLPNMLIDLLAIYYNLSSASSWARLREMYEKELISKIAYYYLISIVSTCTMLRTVVYLENNSQCDDLVVNYSGYSEESISSIFKTLLPLEIYMHEFVDSVGEEFPFSNVDAFLNSESVAQIRIFDMKDEHDELIRYLENQISELLVKNLRQYFIKDNQGIIEELENDDSVNNVTDDDNSKNNFLPWCINCLGRAYFKKADFKRAFVVYSNASRIYPKQTAIYSHLACVYEELGNYKLAIINHIKTIMVGIGIEFFIIKMKELVERIIKKDNFDLSAKEFKIYRSVINYICFLSKSILFSEKACSDFYILNSLVPYIEDSKYEDEMPIVLEKLTEFSSMFDLKEVLPRKKWMHEIIKCVSEMLSNLCLTLDKAEDYINAELAGNIAVKFELFRSPEYPSDSLITYKHNLVNVYIHRYKFHKAEEEINKILKQTKSQSGPRSRSYVRSLKLKAEIYYDLEKHDKAIHVCRKALSIIRRSDYSDYCSEEETYLYLCLGQAWSRVNDLDKATQALNNSIYKAKDLFGTSHHVTAIVLSNCAESMRRLGQFDLAERYKKEAIQIYSSGLLYNDAHLLTLNSGLGLIWFEAGVGGFGLLRFRGGANVRRKKSKNKGIDIIKISYRKFQILLEDFEREKDYVNFSTCVNNYAGTLNSPELFDLYKITDLYKIECIPFLKKLKCPYTYNLIAISYFNLAKSYLLAINYRADTKLKVYKCEFYIKALHYTNKALKYRFMKSPNHYEIEMCEILLTISHCFYALDKLSHALSIIDKAIIIMENNFILFEIDKHKLSQYNDTKFHIYFDIVAFLITVYRKMSNSERRPFYIDIRYYEVWLEKHKPLKKRKSFGYTYTLDNKPLEVPPEMKKQLDGQAILIFYSFIDQLENIRKMEGVVKDPNNKAKNITEFIMPNLTADYTITQCSQIDASNITDIFIENHNVEPTSLTSTPNIFNDHKIFNRNPSSFISTLFESNRESSNLSDDSQEVLDDAEAERAIEEYDREQRDCAEEDEVYEEHGLEDKTKKIVAFD